MNTQIIWFGALTSQALTLLPFLPPSHPSSVSPSFSQLFINHLLWARYCARSQRYKILLELPWPCLGERLGYSALSFVASLMLPLQPRHWASSPFLSLSSCCFFHFCNGGPVAEARSLLWLLLLVVSESSLTRVCAMELGPPSTAASLPRPAQCAPHPLGEQGVSSFHAGESLPRFTGHSDPVTPVILHTKPLSFHSQALVVCVYLCPC